jgi:hypothetical protein
MSPRRRLTIGLLSLGLTGGLAGPGLAAPAGPSGGSRLMVYAQEWSLYGSRATVPAGRITVQLWNRGQDAHDLRARRLLPGRRSGRAVAGIAKTASAAIGQGSWRLSPGRYELYCALSGHRMKGMHFVLSVH